MGFDRTIATKTIKVYEEDVSGNILFATGTDAAATQDGIAGYAKGAVYVKTDVAGGTDGRYINIGTTASSSFALEAAAVTPGSITATELASDAVETAKILDAQVTSAKLAETTIQYAEVLIDATEIVGTAAGDLGHASGAELVAAPGAGKVLEFVSAMFIYDFDTAAYTGGGNDLVVRQGTTSVSSAIASADLLGAAGDKITLAPVLSAADIPLTANQNINIASTAWTNPGTAAGVLRVKVAYRVHTTGL